MSKAQNVHIISIADGQRTHSTAYSHRLAVTDIPVAITGTSRRNITDGRPIIIVQSRTCKLSGDRNGFVARSSMVCTSRYLDCDSRRTGCLVYMANGDCSAAYAYSSNIRIVGCSSNYTITRTGNSNRLGQGACVKRYAGGTQSLMNPPLCR